jgi:hypothetical protein
MQRDQAFTLLLLTIPWTRCGFTVREAHGWEVIEPGRFFREVTGGENSSAPPVSIKIEINTLALLPLQG